MIHGDRSLRALFAAAILVGLSASVALAAEEPAFGLQPVTFDPAVPATQSYFIFDARPGEVIRSRFRVINSGPAAGTARLSTADATTGQTSGTVFLTEGQARSAAGAWIDMDETQVKLGPGERREIEFTLRVPAEVRPGQHVGGIVAEDLNPPKAVEQAVDGTTAGVQITVRKLNIMAVQVNLPGPQTESLELIGLRGGGENGFQRLLLGLRNSGNVMLKPTGTLQVVDAQGRQLQNLPLTLDTVLPRTTIDYPVFVEGTALAPGTYTANVTLTYGADQQLRESILFTITEAQVAQAFEGARQPLAAPNAMTSDSPASLPLPLVLGLGTVLGGLLGAAAVGLAVRRRRQVVLQG